MRMVITLDEQERRALRDLAAVEMRYPRDQVRLIVRQELARRGLLPEATAVKGVKHDRQ